MGKVFRVSGPPATFRNVVAAAESDSSVGLNRIQVPPFNISVESNQPVSFTRRKSKQIPLVSETDLAFTVSQGLPLSQVVESDSSLTIAFQGNLPIGTITQEAVTPHQIAVYADVTGSIAADAYATVRYRVATIGAWKTGHPLYRIDPGGANDAFAGCIFNLEPGNSYDVEVTLVSGVASDIRGTAEHGAMATRALPPAAGAPTSTPSTVSAMESALSSASPGDVIELQDGTYDFSGLMTIDQSGTEANPIYVRGESIDGTIISVPSGRGVDLDADWIVLENLTINGSGGLTNAIRVGISGTTGNNCVIRDVKITNFGRGIMTSGGTSGEITSGVLVYNCELTGEAPWTLDGINNNTYWSEDGIRLVGVGNCVWRNTLEGYGDSITFAHSVSDDIRACFAYLNFIRNSVDDAIELDHHVRNIGVYDNYFENVKTTWSQSDETSSGPMWVFRNYFVNFAIGEKFNAHFDGFHVYSNTWLKADVPDAATSARLANSRGRGDFNASPSGSQERFAWRNNLLIYRGTKTPTVGNREVWRVRWGGISECTMSHNAHYPDIDLNWEGEEGFDDLADAISHVNTTVPVYASGAGMGAPTKRYASDTVISESSPFVTDIVLGSDCLTEITGKQLLQIAAGTAPKNAGTAVPNITDDYSGSSPDIGANIAGQATRYYGRQETVLEQFAASLAPGDSDLFDASNNGGPTIAFVRRQDIQQQTSTLYYAPNRKEWQLMGKAAQSQSGNHTHYLYDEVANTFVNTTDQEFNGIVGHLWCHAFDPDTGDYYFIQVNQKTIWRFVRADWDGVTPNWVESSNGGDTLFSQNTSGHGGMGWHPNLFGSGQGGVVVRASRWAAAWKKSDDSWQAASSNYDPSDANALHSNGGQGIYFPNLDAVIVGTGDDEGNGNPLQRFNAGSGGSPTTSPVTLADTPVEVRGKSGSSNYAHLVLDPANPAHMLLLERLSPYRVWRSTDYGVSWGSSVGNHPCDWEHFTCGSAHGIVWFLSSGVNPAPNNGSLVWKPNL